MATCSLKRARIVDPSTSFMKYHTSYNFQQLQQQYKKSKSLSIATNFNTKITHPPNGIQWEICVVDVSPSKTPKHTNIVFPKRVTKQQLCGTVRAILDRAKDCHPMNDQEIDYILKHQIQQRDEQCTMELTHYLLHVLRCFGMGAYFEINAIYSSKYTYQTKTVTLHPLLLRLYTMMPDFRIQPTPKPTSMYSNNTAHVFNVMTIIGSWCNNVSPLLSCDIMHQTLIEPLNPYFCIYKCLHRLVDRWFSDADDEADPSTFLTLYQTANLPKLIGIFIYMKNIRYMRLEVYEHLCGIYYDSIISEDKRLVTLHPKCFALFKYNTLTLKFRQRCPIIQGLKESWVDLTMLDPNVNPMDYAYEVYMLASDYNISHVFARKLMTAFRLQPTPQTNRTNIVDQTKFRGYKLSRRRFLNRIHYMDLITDLSPTEYVPQLACDFMPPNKLERMYPLEVFLSILDHQTMKTKFTYKEHIVCELDKLYKTVKTTLATEGDANVIHLSEPVDGLKITKEPLLDLPVFGPTSYKSSIDRISFHQSFFLISNIF